MDERARIDETWPVQRLRIGLAAVFLYIFEVTIGRQFPPLFTTAMLTLGLVCLGSAAFAIREFRAAMTRLLIAEATKEARAHARL